MPLDTDEYGKVIMDLSERMAYAIAVAEGYFATDSLPSRLNNPGDMKLGDRGRGVTDDGKTRFATPDDGWAALRRECVAILTGASHVYTVHDTMETVSLKWTGGDNPGAWCKIVTEKLGIDPLMSMVDWVKGTVEAQDADNNGGNAA